MKKLTPKILGCILLLITILVITKPVFATSANTVNCTRTIDGTTSDTGTLIGTVFTTTGTFSGSITDDDSCYPVFQLDSSFDFPPDVIIGQFSLNNTDGYKLLFGIDGLFGSFDYTTEEGVLTKDVTFLFITEADPLYAASLISCDEFTYYGPSWDLNVFTQSLGDLAVNSFSGVVGIHCPPGSSPFMYQDGERTLGVLYYVTRDTRLESNKEYQDLTFGLAVIIFILATIYGTFMLSIYKKWTN